MLTEALAYEREYKEDDDEHDNLVGTLECYTHELGILCEELEAQPLEAKDIEEDVDEDMKMGIDTLGSLENMTQECAILLACLDAEENGSEDTDDDDEKDALLKDFVQSSGREKDSLQEETLKDSFRQEELTHELDSFAEELEFLVSCLGDSDTEEKRLESEDKEASLAEELTCLQDDEKDTLKCRNNADAVRLPTAASGNLNANGATSSADEVHLAHKNKAFSERTKKAIALHVKRRELERSRLGSRLRSIKTTNASHSGTDADNSNNSRIKVTWSRFQSASFQHHVIRQAIARHRVQQIREAQHPIESGHLRRKTGASYRCAAGSVDDKTKRKVTYLDKFSAASAHSVPLHAFESQYLCAVYVYNLRSLGTTYITFSSLTQLKQRIQARFAIESVVSIYRETSEVVIPQPARQRYSGRQRRVKRLRRIASLEQVRDGDTLCATQNAYDDMNILSEWIKQRQRIVYDFQLEVHQSSASTTKDKKAPPLKPKTMDKLTSKSQLWDSNGRSIGVGVQ